MWEQVVAYRTALNCRQWIGVEQTGVARKKAGSSFVTLGEGFIDAMPPSEPSDTTSQAEDEIVRQGPETGRCWILVLIDC
jgi:hypothetical protein